MPRSREVTKHRAMAVDGAGRYVGVGAILQVLQAGSALYRRRAREMAELARGLAKSVELH